LPLEFIIHPHTENMPILSLEKVSRFNIDGVVITPSPAIDFETLDNPLSATRPSSVSSPWIVSNDSRQHPVSAAVEAGGDESGGGQLADPARGGSRGVRPPLGDPTTQP